MTDQPQAPTPGQDLSPAGTSTGLQPNVAGALAYLFGAITGIIFLVMEKKSPFVRFHAAQSIGIFLFFIVFGFGLGILSMALGAIPVIGVLAGILFFLLSLVLGFGGFLLWLFLMYKAFQGEEWEFPLVGPKIREMLG